MKIYSTKEFKNEKAVIEAIIQNYKIYKFKLERLLKDEKSHQDNNMTCLYTSYVNMIDSIISRLNAESRMIIQKIYLENIRPEDLPFCVSTFYTKLKKAIKEFLDYYR